MLRSDGRRALIKPDAQEPPSMRIAARVYDLTLQGRAGLESPSSSRKTTPSSSAVGRPPPHSIQSLLTTHAITAALRDFVQGDHSSTGGVCRPGACAVVGYSLEEKIPSFAKNEQVEMPQSGVRLVEVTMTLAGDIEALRHQLSVRFWRTSCLVGALMDWCPMWGPRAQLGKQCLANNRPLSGPGSAPFCDIQKW